MRYAILGWLIHDRVPMWVFVTYCVYATTALLLRFMKLIEAD